ncbi:hypothetical protein CISIN_1g0322981mg, partial [Citrus sinensis]
MSYSWPLSSSGKEEGEMHRRKGDVVGTCKLGVVGETCTYRASWVVVGNGKPELVAEETYTCTVSLVVVGNGKLELVAEETGICMVSWVVVGNDILELVVEETCIRMVSWVEVGNGKPASVVGNDKLEVGGGGDLY